MHVSINISHGNKCVAQEVPIFEDGRMVGCRAVVRETICADCLEQLQNDGYIIRVEESQLVSMQRRPVNHNRIWSSDGQSRQGTQYAIHQERASKKNH